MIVFENDLTKYINDQEWYNLEFLLFEKKCWMRFYNSYEKKNYKTPNKIEEKYKQMDMATNQIELINTLIDLLENTQN